MDNDFIRELFGTIIQTKEQVINLYIQGKITKDEYIKRMEILDRNVRN